MRYLFYIEEGLGIGIVAQMAYVPEADSDLVALDASKLFSPSITKIGCRRGTFLRGYMYEFIELLALNDIDEQAAQAQRTAFGLSATEATEAARVAAKAQELPAVAAAREAGLDRRGRRDPAEPAGGDGGCWAWISRPHTILRPPKRDGGTSVVAPAVLCSTRKTRVASAPGAGTPNGHILTQLRQDAHCGSTAAPAPQFRHLRASLQACSESNP